MHGWNTSYCVTNLDCVRVYPYGTSDAPLQKRKTHPFANHDLNPRHRLTYLKERWAREKKLNGHNSTNVTSVLLPCKPKQCTVPRSLYRLSNTIKYRVTLAAKWPANASYCLLPLPVCGKLHVGVRPQKDADGVSEGF